MKTYKDFLTEKKAWSERGEAIRRKKREQNELNRKKKVSLAPADKGSDIVKYKKSREEEIEDNKREARQKLASGSAGEPKLKRKPKPPSVSAQRSRQTALERNAAKAKAEKDAKDKFDRKSSGFGSGVKKALGGDVIGMSRKGSQEYKDLVDKRNREKKKEAGEKLVKGAIGTAGKVAGKIINQPTNKDVPEYAAKPIA